MKIGIRDFDQFLRGDFAKRVREDYENFAIKSEADLQAKASMFIEQYLNEHDKTRKRFEVNNKLYMKDIRIHPDVAIFKGRKPWVILELKERMKMTLASAKKEQERLISIKKRLSSRKLSPKRGYLIYLVRFGMGTLVHGPKGPGARFFYEIPISLQQCWTDARIRKWQQEFKKRSRFSARLRT